ncbi:MAG: bifunctional DNA-formamidopyrimidine glycosylase/DNA-(apurinic or apyrimidinic site) lyase [Devosiaceae bacterium]
MPELPEVETVRRGLAPALEGAHIVGAEVRRPDLRFPFPDGLQNLLEGARITALTRRAKYLLIELDKGTTLIAHLGMSGSYRVHSLLDQPLCSVPERPLAHLASSIPGQFHHERSTLGAHDHLVLQVEGGASGPAEVIYNDPRRFGFVLSAPTHQLYEHPFLADLGPEPLGNALSSEHLAKRFTGKRSPIKSALLDQKNIAGLGNIYVCEALSRAHISPKRLAQTLVKTNGAPTQRLEVLTQIIRDVISEAIEAGGSSLRDHKQTDGSLGYFQHRFGVYDREHDPCPTLTCQGTVKRIVQSGRSTFYCPACQR